MKDVYQQTGFNLDEVLELLKNPPIEYPECLLLNELGAIIYFDQDQESKGEKKMLEYLKNRHPQYRAIAAFYLSAEPQIAERNSAALTEFRNQPKNKQLLLMVDEALNE
jgi:hypothetical protein